MVSKSKAIEKRKNLDKAALNGEPIPDGLNLAEQMYYVSARRLYTDWKDKKITEDEARADKRRLEDGYLDAVYAYGGWRHYVEIRDIFCMEFHKEGTGCDKCGECRLFRVLSELKWEEENEHQ